MKDQKHCNWGSSTIERIKDGKLVYPQLVMPIRKRKQLAFN